MSLDPAHDPLGEIDRILRTRAGTIRAMDERAAELQAELTAFLDAFRAKCENEIAPTMETIVARLRQNGGGGLVAYQPDGRSANTAPRLTLWMSLEGEIRGTPRQDRHPYLQLDADLKSKQAKISEGDMWEGAGSRHSGPLGLWNLKALTAAAVTDEVLSILSRAAGEPINSDW